jgi:hypothetical protein
MGLAPKILRVVFGAVEEMNSQGKTVLLVEQNARAGLRMAGYGVVLENGRVRLTGTGAEVLEHPEIGLLYLGGQIESDQSDAAEAGPGEVDTVEAGTVEAGTVEAGTVEAGTVEAGTGRPGTAQGGPATPGPS